MTLFYILQASEELERRSTTSPSPKARGSATHCDRNVGPVFEEEGLVQPSGRSQDSGNSRHGSSASPTTGVQGGICHSSLPSTFESSIDTRIGSEFPSISRAQQQRQQQHQQQRRGGQGQPVGQNGSAGSSLQVSDGPCPSEIVMGCQSDSPSSFTESEALGDSRRTFGNTPPNLRQDHHSRHEYHGLRNPLPSRTDEVEFSSRHDAANLHSRFSVPIDYTEKQSNPSATDNPSSPGVSAASTPNVWESRLLFDASSPVRQHPQPLNYGTLPPPLPSLSNFYPNLNPLAATSMANLSLTKAKDMSLTDKSEMNFDELHFHSDEEEQNYENDDGMALPPLEDDGLSTSIWPPLPMPLFDNKTVKHLIESAEKKDSEGLLKENQSSSGISSAAESDDFNASAIPDKRPEPSNEDLEIPIDKKKFLNSMYGIGGRWFEPKSCPNVKAPSSEANDTIETVEASIADEDLKPKHYCEKTFEGQDFQGSNNSRYSSNYVSIAMGSDEENEISQVFEDSKSYDAITDGTEPQDCFTNAVKTYENFDLPGEGCYSDLDQNDHVQDIEDLIDKYEKLCYGKKSAKQKQKFVRRKQNIHLLKNHRKYHQTSSSSESLLEDSTKADDFKSNADCDEHIANQNLVSGRKGSISLSYEEEPPAKRRSTTANQSEAEMFMAIALKCPLQERYRRGGYGMPSDPAKKASSSKADSTMEGKNVFPLFNYVRLDTFSRFQSLSSFLATSEMAKMSLTNSTLTDSFNSERPLTTEPKNEPSTRSTPTSTSYSSSTLTSLSKTPTISSSSTSPSSTPATFVRSMTNSFQNLTLKRPRSRSQSPIATSPSAANPKDQKEEEEKVETQQPSRQGQENGNPIYWDRAQMSKKRKNFQSPFEDPCKFCRFR